MARYCFDIDGTLCTKTHNDYRNARPIQKMIDIINDLYEQGHIVIIYTTRGQTSGSAIDWEEFTIQQIKGWGVKFHEFYHGKPLADYYIDDRAVKINDFLLGNF